MGATSWTYFTPYTPDAGAALERLRQETFAAGNYQAPAGGWREELQRILDIVSDPHIKTDDMGLMGDAEHIQHLMKICSAYESGSIEGLSEAEQSEVEDLRRAVELSLRSTGPHRGLFASKFKKKRPAKTIAGLLRQAGQTGTHSILDIRSIAQQPGYGVAWPLPPGELMIAFGTERPTREQVEEFGGELAEELGRWQAVYFIIHVDNKPTEYAFVGSSGD